MGGGEGQTNIFHKKKSNLFIFPQSSNTGHEFLFTNPTTLFPRIFEKRQEKKKKKICGCYPGPSFYPFFSAGPSPLGEKKKKAG